MTRTFVAALVVLAACTDSGPTYDYPKDDERTLFHVQSRGTHNSYHLEPPDNDVPEWMYSHDPLDVQLSNGVRQFELDVNVNVFDDRFEVYHFIRADEETTCHEFVECLRVMKRWSDANRGHHPFAVMIEIKDTYDPNYADHFFELFETELESVWPRDRLVTPDLVRGDHATLKEAVATDGWPTLGELRGRALFFLLGSDDNDAHYTSNHTTLAGRLAFVDAPIDMPYAAVTKVDNPISGSAELTAALNAGMLVRTRIDADSTSGPMVDQTRFDAALQIGAHFLSSDAVGVTIPGGSPSRCNPVTAPADCQAIELEDPAFVD